VLVLGVVVEDGKLNKFSKFGALNGLLVRVFDEFMNGIENELIEEGDDDDDDEDAFKDEFEINDEKILIKLLLSNDDLFVPIGLLFSSLLLSLAVLVNRKSSIVLFILVNSFEFASFDELSSDDDNDDGVVVDVVLVVVVVVVVLVDAVEIDSKLLLESSFIGRSLRVNPLLDDGLEVVDLLFDLFELLLLLLLFGRLLIKSSIEVILFEFRNLLEGIVVLLIIELNRSLALLFKLNLFDVRLVTGAIVVLVDDGLFTFLLLSNNLEKPSSDLNSFEPESDSGSLLIKLFRLNSTGEFDDESLVLRAGNRSFNKLVLGDSLL